MELHHAWLLFSEWSRDGLGSWVDLSSRPGTDGTDGTDLSRSSWPWLGSSRCRKRMNGQNFIEKQQIHLVFLLNKWLKMQFSLWMSRYFSFIMRHCFKGDQMFPWWNLSAHNFQSMLRTCFTVYKWLHIKTNTESFNSPLKALKYNTFEKWGNIKCWQNGLKWKKQAECKWRRIKSVTACINLLDIFYSICIIIQKKSTFFSVSCKCRNDLQLSECWSQHEEIPVPTVSLLDSRAGAVWGGQRSLVFEWLWGLPLLEH